eukprot:TRINITY_DN71760_c0_g1_i1.p1 TRINITY_DN71760_c0_g1~~TRINITY_DN71760_c0_g1_i1.p1  ORF type:complete len:144 (-),score=20.12 TRINITY_DN71760_c0_g1_i1:82-513(-)
MMRSRAPFVGFGLMSLLSLAGLPGAKTTATVGEAIADGIMDLGGKADMSTRSVVRRSRRLRRKRRGHVSRISDEDFPKLYRDVEDSDLILGIPKVCWVILANIFAVGFYFLGVRVIIMVKPKREEVQLIDEKGANQYHDEVSW